MYNEIDWECVGGLWLAQVPTAIAHAIVAYVQQQGSEAPTRAKALHAEMIGGQPLLAFLPKTGNVKVHAHLALGLQCVLRDAVGAEWSVEKYSTMLQRTAGIGEEYARKLAAEVFTPEGGAADFALKFLNWLPDIPFTTIDDHARGALKSVVDVLARALPQFLTGRSQDNLFEFMKLGEKLSELRMRAVLKANSDSYVATNDGPRSEDGTMDREALRDVAAIALPVAIKNLGTYLSTTAGSEAGAGLLGPAASGVMGLLGAGDLDDRDGGGSDVNRGARLATAIARAVDAARNGVTTEWGDVALHSALTEVADGLSSISPEEGGLFGDILKFVGRAAPTVGGAFGPIGAGAGQILGQGLSMLGDHSGNGGNQGKGNPGRPSGRSGPGATDPELRKMLAELVQLSKRHFTSTARDSAAIKKLLMRTSGAGRTPPVPTLLQHMGIMSTMSGASPFTEPQQVPPFTVAPPPEDEGGDLLGDKGTVDAEQGGYD